MARKKVDSNKLAKMAKEKPSSETVSTQVGQVGPVRNVILTLRNRVLSGLFLALPIVITFIVIKWIYDTLAVGVIRPIAEYLASIWYQNDASKKVQVDETVLTIITSFLAIIIILAILFCLGMFFRSRLHRLMDWILLSVPGVSTIYSAVTKVIDAIQKSRESDTKKSQRIVLVHFPHRGMKVPAFVMSTCQDKLTGKTILCVYAPSTPVPTSGFMMLVPEDDVTDLSWDMQDTLQAVMSGGLTVPDTVDYFSSLEEVQRRSS